MRKLHSVAHAAICGVEVVTLQGISTPATGAPDRRWMTVDGAPQCSHRGRQPLQRLPLPGECFR